MKNKFLLKSLVLSSVILVSGCKGNNVLLVLNWGEYINEDLVVAFEDYYDVRVVMNLASSSELMEQ